MAAGKLGHYINHGIQQGSSEVRKFRWARFDYGQIIIEILKHILMTPFLESLVHVVTRILKYCDDSVFCLVFLYHNWYPRYVDIVNSKRINIMTRHVWSLGYERA